MWYRKPVEITNAVARQASSVESIHVREVKETPSNSNDIRLVPSFQLRTTAVPSATQRQPVSISSRLFIVFNQIKLVQVEIETIVSKDESPSDPNAPSATEIVTHKKTSATDVPDVPTFISRGIQADLQTASGDTSTGIPIRYYERQPVKVTLHSAFISSWSPSSGL